jgi:hypothetical protein
MTKRITAVESIILLSFAQQMTMESWRQTWMILLKQTYQWQDSLEYRRDSLKREKFTNPRSRSRNFWTTLSNTFNTLPLRSSVPQYLQLRIASPSLILAREFATMIFRNGPLLLSLQQVLEQLNHNFANVSLISFILVVTPVLWNHERVGKHWLNTPVITIGRKDLNSLKTLQSPLHNAQFGVLNWWGLGGKLAAANLGGKQSQLILKTKPKSGKPGMAVVRPGIWNYQVGQLSEADFPKDDIIKLQNVSSFIEFTIANADLQKLLRDTRLQEYEKKLSVEFCNVYYPYLIGVDVRLPNHLRLFSAFLM